MHSDIKNVHHTQKIICASIIIHKQVLVKHQKAEMERKDKTNLPLPIEA